MKKVLSIALSLVLGSLLLTGCTGTSGTPTATPTVNATAEPTAEPVAADTELNLYTWEGMFPQEVLDGFKQETGITINYSNFDFNETMLAKLEVEKGGGYDLVIADDYIIETAITQGLAQKLDVSKLENYKNINPVYQNQFYDPENEYTVPFGAGVLTIVYDPNTVSKEITSYEDLWDSSLKDNIGIISNYRVINGFSLKTLKESYNTEDIDVINAAKDKLLGLAPNIRLIKDDNIQDDLLSGEIGVAVMYTSQVTMAMLTNPELKVVYPSEGIGFGIMAKFIPSNAPHPDAAHKFIDYILRPEISAQAFEYLGYYCTNEAAEALINEDFKEFLTLPPDFLGDMEMIQNISAEADEAHAKAWTEFKSACGQ